VCAGKSEVVIRVNVQTCTVEFLTESILKRELSMAAPEVTLLTGRAIVTVPDDDDDRALLEHSIYPRTLAQFDVADGTKCGISPLIHTHSPSLSFSLSFYVFSPTHTHTHKTHTKNNERFVVTDELQKYKVMLIVRHSDTIASEKGFEILSGEVKAEEDEPVPAADGAGTASRVPTHT
jgi:hypothetical protein